MDYLPIFLRVQNRLAVVIGGGAIAARKAELLLKCGARIRLVAPELAASTQQLLQQPAAAAQMSHLPAAFAAEHPGTCLAAHPPKLWYSSGLWEGAYG